MKKKINKYCDKVLSIIFWDYYLEACAAYQDKRALLFNIIAMPIKLLYKVTL